MKPKFRELPPERKRELNKLQQQKYGSGYLSSKKVIRKRIIKLYGDKCHLCDEVTPKEDRTIDHLIPKGKGGTNDIENLRLAHMFCHRLKNDIETGFKKLFGEIPDTSSDL